MCFIRFEPGLKFKLLRGFHRMAPGPNFVYENKNAPPFKQKSGTNAPYTDTGYKLRSCRTSLSGRVYFNFVSGSLDCDRFVLATDHNSHKWRILRLRALWLTIATIGKTRIFLKKKRIHDTHFTPWVVFAVMVGKSDRPNVLEMVFPGAKFGYTPSVW